MNKKEKNLVSGLLTVITDLHWKNYELQLENCKLTEENEENVNVGS